MCASDNQAGAQGQGSQPRKLRGTGMMPRAFDAFAARAASIAVQRGSQLKVTVGPVPGVPREGADKTSPRRLQANLLQEPSVNLSVGLRGVPMAPRVRMPLFGREVTQSEAPAAEWTATSMQQLDTSSAGSSGPADAPAGEAAGEAADGPAGDAARGPPSVPDSSAGPAAFASMG